VGTVKKQKRARKEALKNRYYAGAKLSEHKFLRILHGFAAGIPIKELEKMTHTSAKTIRAIYRLLRERLALAIFAEPESFGRAGFYLTRPAASTLLDAARNSIHFRRYKKRHAPRPKYPADERALLIELTVRVFCALDLRGLKIELDAVLEILAHGLLKLKGHQPLQKLVHAIPGVRSNGYPAMRFYEDYRRFLLKNPLGIR